MRTNQVHMVVYVQYTLYLIDFPQNPRNRSMDYLVARNGIGKRGTRNEERRTGNWELGVGTGSGEKEVENEKRRTRN